MDRLRRVVGTRRVGHAGTLDPFATGLLLLAWGRATRLLAFLSAAPKTYRATLLLGTTTDTGDHTGRTVAHVDVPAGALDAARLAETARAFVGEIEQTVPVYSAVKVGGEPLHRKARRGEVVAPPTRRVTVHALTIGAVDAARGTVEFDVTCSSGTYVRSLAVDWGTALGVGGTLLALRRLAIGRHSVAGAISTRDLLDRPEGSIPEWNARLIAAGLTPEQALADLPRLDLTADECGRLAHGAAPTRARALALGLPATSDAIALFDTDGLLAGVATLADLPAGNEPGAPLGLRWVASGVVDEAEGARA